MPTLSNRYDLGAVIYSDASVVVYNAHDRLLNRAVTIEMLQAQHAANPALVDELLRKGRDAALASLPNVAAVYDQHTVDGRPFLVLEEVAGPALGAVAPLPLAQTVALVCELAATVQTALKRAQPLPTLSADTVRIGPEERIQVLDFGLAQARPTAEQALAALGGLLQTALAGTADTQGSAPVRAVAERALRNGYPTPEALAADLQALEQRANQPTTVLQRMPETVPIDDPVGDQSAAGTTAPLRQAIGRPPLKLLAGGGALVVVLLLGALSLRGVQSTRSQPDASIAASAAGASSNTGAGAEVGASAAPPAASQPAPAGSAPAASLPAGEPYIVAARGSRTVRVRSGPSLGATQIASIPNGTVLQVVSPPQSADGYTWVRIISNGVDGWCILEALRKQ